MSSARSSFQNFKETNKQAGQLIELLQNPTFQEKSTRTLDGVSRLRDSLMNVTEQQQKTLSRLKSEKAQLQREIAETCSSIGGKEMTLEEIEEVVASENSRLMELKGVVTAQDKENQTIADAELYTKMLQKLIPVNFDLNSTHSDVKGFIRNANSKIKPFSFDSANDKIAEALWTAASEGSHS